MTRESSTAPWDFHNPQLDFAHRYRGYPRELKSIGSVIAARLRGQYREPESRFVIFGRGRSGSTLLVRMLDQHRDITCLGELLRCRLVFPHAYRDRCLRLSATPCSGFKLLSYQVTQVMGVRPDSGYLRQMQDEGFRVIYIHRDNYLRLAVSNMYARLRGRFHVDGAVNSGEKTEAHYFAPDELLQWMQGAATRTAEERELLRGVDYFDVLYERDLEAAESQEATIARLFRWFGVEEQAVSPSLRQATPRRLNTIIKNYDEVECTLRNSEFSRFLDSA